MKKINLLFFTVALWAVTLVATGQNAVKPLPVVIEEEAAAEVIPGDGTQHMLDFSYCESDPDRIYMAQDVGSIWVSQDAGKNWWTLSNYGLHSPFAIAVEADPLNKDRVLSVVQCRHYDGVNQEYQGIYLSTDGGITWDRKMAREDLGEVRSSTRLLAYAPSSKDPNLGYATRWYAAFSEFKALQAGDTTVADDGLVYSDDGGETWTEIRKLPTSTFGKQIRGIRVHPLHPDTVYMYGTGGLYRFSDATNPSGAHQVLSGVNGLPTGDIWGRIYISPDGQTITVPVRNKGLYKSVDGGASWSELYAWTAIRYAFFNEGHPDYIYAVPNRSSGQQVRVSKTGGSSWITGVQVTPRPGFSGNWNNKIFGDFACILPDPRNPDRVFAHNNSKHFQSDDGGESWYPSDNGFNGSQHVGLNTQQMFDPTNPDRFAYFMVDRGVIYTDTRGEWFELANINYDSLDLTWHTVKGGAVLPDSIILASVGRSPNGQLIRSTNNGKTWAKVVTTGNKPRWVVAYDPDSTNYCYQWRERSDDYGETWQELTNMPTGTIIAGMAPSDGQILYAIEIKNDASRIWRSTDRGTTWGNPVVEAGWNLTYPGADEQFAFRVHPTDPDVIFTSNATGQIRRWNLNTGINTDFDVTDACIGGVLDENFFAYLFAIDPLHPEVMYILNRRANTGNKLFRSEDNGGSWTNISDGFPNASIGSFSISPISGEVYFASQNGSRVMLPPYATSNTAYELIPYGNNHLDEPYSDGNGTCYQGCGTIPGRIEGEDYDKGGEGVAYHDSTAGNSGGVYRTDNVDIAATSDSTGAYNVGWINNGEWLTYTLGEVSAGVYDIRFRIASNDTITSKSITVSLDSVVLGVVAPAYTGGWQNWQTISLDSVSIPAGSGQKLRLDFAGGNFNFNFFEFEESMVSQSPYGGVPRTIPGLIEGEEYDLGGEGVAYHDDGIKQGETTYRPADNVDIAAKAGASNGYSIGWSEPGEWVEFTVDVTEGTYDIIFYYASGATTPPYDLEVSLDNTVIATFDDLHNTTDWNTFTTDTLHNVAISGGTGKILRLEYVGTGGKFDIDAIRFEPVNAMVAHWMFDETTGTVAPEELNAIDGTVSGLLSSDWTPADSPYGTGSLRFRGINTPDAHVEFPYHEETDFDSSGFSISFLGKYWMNSSNVTILQNGGNNGSAYYRLHSNWSSLRFTIKDTNGVSRQLAITDASLNGEWSHIVAVRDPANQVLKLYRDGVLLDSISDTTVGNIDIPTGHAMYFGADPALSGTDFSGSVDDLRLYNRALTDAEVADLFEDLTGSGQPLLARSLEKNNLVVYPNPIQTARQLHIQYKGSIHEGTYVRVVDMMGRIHVRQRMKGSDIDIKLNGSRAHLYIVQIESEGKVVDSVRLLID